MKLRINLTKIPSRTIKVLVKKVMRLTLCRTFFITNFSDAHSSNISASEKIRSKNVQPRVTLTALLNLTIINDRVKKKRIYQVMTAFMILFDVRDCQSRRGTKTKTTFFFHV